MQYGHDEMIIALVGNFGDYTKFKNEISYQTDGQKIGKIISMDEMAKRYAKEGNIPFLESPVDENVMDICTHVLVFLCDKQAQNVVDMAIIKNKCLKVIDP